MSQSFRQQCIRDMKTCDGPRYLWLYIMFHAAPTIKGLKPSNILVLRDKELITLWHKYHQWIYKLFGLNYRIVREKNNRLTVLLYNEKVLKGVLADQAHREILKTYGYQVEGNPEENFELEFDNILTHLMVRFEDLVCPHEVGIFLGYALKDVLTYINNPKTAALHTGYWKVYHDVEEAKSTFKAFDETRQNMMYAFLDGKSVYEAVRCA